MKRTSCLTSLIVGLLMITSTAFANVPSDQFYTFPVVVKSFGQGGTDWRSELCIGNLSSRQITVTILFGSNENDIDGGWVDIPRDETYCWDDILASGFGVSSFSGWLTVMAPEDDNYGMNLPFTASMRVYNWTPTGTYGVNVPAISPEYGLYGLEKYLGAATGIHHWGSVGSSGFRTSVGLMSIEADYSQAVAILLTDADGNIVWEKALWLGPMAFKQISLPNYLSVYDGTLAVLSDGVISSYVTVVDNRSGDGVYRMPMQFDLAELKHLKSLLEQVTMGHERTEKSTSLEEALAKAVERMTLVRRPTGRVIPR